MSDNSVSIDDVGGVPEVHDVYSGDLFSQLLCFRLGLSTRFFSFVRGAVPVASIVYIWVIGGLLPTLVPPGEVHAARFSLLDLLLVLTVGVVASTRKQLSLPNSRSGLLGQFSKLFTDCLYCGVPVFLYAIASSSLFLAAGFAAEYYIACVCMSVAAMVGGYLCQLAIMYSYGKKNVVVVGSGRGAQAVFEELSARRRYKIIGFVDDELAADGDLQANYLGPISRLEELIKMHPIQIVYCALPLKSQYDRAQRVISLCESGGVEVRHPLQIFNTKITKTYDSEAGVGPFSCLRMVKWHWTHIIKRIVDIVAGCILLLLVSPILLVSAIAVKLTDGGPIFYSQIRYGLNRRRFKMYKFRSMVTNADILQATLEDKNEVSGPAFKIKNDPRITKIGAFLRKSSIDELPQLWNVVRGDMSLVGPRPLAIRDVMLIDELSQLRRFSVPPGITCIWQISGRDSSNFENWTRQDLEYIDHWSLKLDFLILLKTIPSVLLGKGAM